MKLRKGAPWNWFKKEEEHNPVMVPERPNVFGYNPITRFHNDFDRLFDNFFRGFDSPSLDMGKHFSSLIPNEWAKPTLDIAAGDKEYRISAELPGVDAKDIQLELSKDTLVVKGEKKQEREEKEENYYRVERSYGSFKRAMSLPEDAEQDGINAVFKNGVLTITVPRKAGDPAKARQIAVNRA